MFSAFLVRLVDASRRHAVAVLLTVLVLALGCAWFAATHFRINTNVDQLLSQDLPFRKQEAEMDQQFPQKKNILLVVVDGDTPDATDRTSRALATAMAARPDLFTYAERPEALPYFRQNGLLFLSKTELAARLDQLVQAQPLLGAMTADPSLRGFFDTISLMAQGVQGGQIAYDVIDHPLLKIAELVQAALAGQTAPLELQGLMSAASKPNSHEVRTYIVSQVVMDYGAMQPGLASRNFVRQLTSQLPDVLAGHAHVRQTGVVALNDEEFASVTEGTGLATVISVVLVFGLLLLALKSLRLVLPILLVLVVGLVFTTAFALVAVGSLNLISVAFAVMFIGIAVDFGIQFGVRFRDQHFKEPELGSAMRRTAAIIAVPFAMAAGSTSLGFFAFIPTDYRGVSELGLIAGAGMLIAFVLNVTLLPALLTLCHPPAEHEAIGYRFAAPVDRFLIRCRRWILLALVPVAGLALFAALHLHFDFDPMDLKDPHTESVATLFDLMKDPDFGAYTITALRPSLAEANDLAAKISQQPLVDHAMTLSSLLPEDQTAKLAMIADTKTLLDPSLNLAVMAPPTEDEIYASMTKLATALHGIEGDGHASAAALATALDEVVKRHDPALIDRLNQALVAPMVTQLNVVKGLLAAGPVTLDMIPDELRHGWVTPDGRYLIEAYPKGDPRNHKVLVGFTDQVQSIAPDAGGTPVSIQASGKTVVHAFVQAGCYALIAIALLALVVLRSVRQTIILLTPLLLAGLLTLATMVAIHLPLNFANIIALPLLLSLGTSYAIYFVSSWRAGVAQPLQSSMARAVLFSAGTVLVAFSSLAVSKHPGTAGMGELLTLALLYSLASTFFILPVLLGPPKIDKSN